LVVFLSRPLHLTPFPTFSTCRILSRVDTYLYSSFCANDAIQLQRTSGVLATPNNGDGRH
jgi:hypothetical protein